MNTEVLEMSEKERDRLVILRQVEKKQITQVQAGSLLKLTDRQIRNLLKALKIEGDKGLISKKRGKPGNHKVAAGKKKKVLKILRTKLKGLGPTLASEKLLELYAIRRSKETVRQWMIQEGLWHPKTSKRKVIHKPRLRRPCFGELIQGDGSHHHWFGSEHEMCNLTVLVDDATGKLTGLHFSKEETLVAYFKTLEQHLLTYGRPRAIYLDRSAIASVRRGDSITQFHKALDKLGIELILAHSPQAKGRVERTNRTLQDRLVHELRLRGINNIDDANAYLPEFIEKYDEKFSRVPSCSVDANQPLEGYDISVILREHKERTLSDSCIFQYDNKFYEVMGLASTRKNKGRKVDLCIASDGTFRVFLDGIERKYIPAKALNAPAQPEVKTRREVNNWRPQRKPVGRGHPWRRWDPKNAAKRKAL